MPTAEIITIGTEILLGEIVDTNSSYIARQLRENGIDIYRTTSIGDNAERIAQAIREARARAQIILTTGGLGPTVDDPTRDAVALAFGVPTEFHEELWQQVRDRFARFDREPTENNRRQAYLPRGATAIENPVGTAPAFFVAHPGGVVFSLPGVPREMQHLLEHAVLPEIRRRFVLDQVLQVRVLHTAGAGESQIDEIIGDLENLANPTVGLAAHSGQVDVRISAKAPSAAEARALIAEVEREVHLRLGNWIYGADEETRESLALGVLAEKGWRLVSVEAGLEGKLVRQLANGNGTFLRGEVLAAPPEEPAALLDATRQYRSAHRVEVGLGIALYAAQPKSDIYLYLITPADQKSLHLPYGGPPALAARRAVNWGLDLLRKL